MMIDDLWLNYLGASYFHEDYDLDEGSPSEVVRRFAINDGLQIVQILYSELAETLVAGLSEDQARKLWMDCAASSYDPAKDGKSYLDRLKEVLTVVGEALRERWLTKRDFFR